MKFQIALSIVALTLAVTQSGLAQTKTMAKTMTSQSDQSAQLNPPNTTRTLQTPTPSDSSSTTRAATQTSDNSAPLYVVPPQNTPPPVTPGENP